MLDEVHNRLMQDTENERGTKRQRTNDGATKSALDRTERSKLSLWKTEIIFGKVAGFSKPDNYL